MKRFAILVGLFTIQCLQAEVVHSSADGFVLRHVLELPHKPEQVYEAIVNQVDAWWHPSHTFTGNTKNLYIEARAGGCFCERLGDEGSVRHAEVLHANPSKLLVLSGGLGPLQQMAVAAKLTFALAARKEGCRVELSYAVGGYYPEGLDTLAAPVDSVLGQLLAGLDSHLRETPH